MTASIPLWVPLVVAILGLIGTAGGAIAGVVITQRRSDARDKATWERERERERERWGREDAARTFEQRRDAYSDFYESLRDMVRNVHDYSRSRAHKEDRELPSEWASPTFGKLLRLELYASREVWQEATQAYGTCWHWGDMLTDGGRADEELRQLQESYNEHAAVLLAAIRADLGIPAGDMDVTEV
jgi:hypothetical protein